MSVINPKKSYSTYNEFITDLLDGVVETDNNSLLTLLHLSGLDLGNLNNSEEDGWQAVLDDIKSRIGILTSDFKKQSQSVGTYIDKNADLSKSFNSMSFDDSSEYWNPSIQKLFEAISQAVSENDFDYSRMEQAAKTADAGYTFRTNAEIGGNSINADDTYVLPAQNLSDQKYSNKESVSIENDLQTARELDRIVTSLKNNRNLQFTANQSKNKERVAPRGETPFSRYSINPTQLIRLLMPKYIRSVEVEDLNRNFWVIGTSLTLLFNALDTYQNHVVSLLDRVLDELIQLWTNIEFLWIEQKVSNQTQDLLVFFQPLTTNNFVNHVKYDNFCAFDSMTYEKELQFESSDYQNLFSSVTNFINMPKEEKREFLLNIGKNYYDYYISQYPKNSILIIPEIRVSNYQNNYYNQVCYIGVILYDDSLAEGKKWFAIPFESTFGLDLLGELVPSNSTDVDLSAPFRQMFQEQHLEGLRYDPRDDNLITNSQIFDGNSLSELDLIGMHYNKNKDSYAFSLNASSQLEPYHFYTAVRTSITGSITKDYNEDTEEYEIKFNQFGFAFEDAVSAMLAKYGVRVSGNQTVAKRGVEFMGNFKLSSDNLNTSPTINLRRKSYSDIFSESMIKDDRYPPLGPATSLEVFASNFSNTYFIDRKEVCSWFLSKNHYAYSSTTTQQRFDAVFNFAIKITEDIHSSISTLVSSIPKIENGIVCLIEAIVNGPDNFTQKKFIIPVNLEYFADNSTSTDVLYYNSTNRQVERRTDKSISYQKLQDRAEDSNDIEKYLYIPVRIPDLPVVNSYGNIATYTVTTSVLTFNKINESNQVLPIIEKNGNADENIISDDCNQSLKNFFSDYNWSIFGNREVTYKNPHCTIKFKTSGTGLRVLNVPIVPVNYFAHSENDGNLTGKIIEPSTEVETENKTNKITDVVYQKNIASYKDNDPEYVRKDYLLGQSFLLHSINAAEDSGNYNWFESSDNQYMKNYPNIMFANSMMLGTDKTKEFELYGFYVKDNEARNEAKYSDHDYFKFDYHKIALWPKKELRSSKKNYCYVRPTYIANTPLIRVMYGNSGHYYKSGINYVQAGVIPRRTNVVLRSFREAWLYQRKNASMVEGIRKDDWIVRVNTVFYELMKQDEINKYGLTVMPIDLSEETTRLPVQVGCTTEIFTGNEVFLKAKARKLNADNTFSDVWKDLDITYQMEAENRYTYLLQSYMKTLVPLLYFIYCELPTYYNNDGEIINKDSMDGCLWEIAQKIKDAGDNFRRYASGLFGFILKKNSRVEFKKFYDVICNLNADEEQRKEYIYSYNFKNLQEVRANTSAYGNLSAQVSFFKYITKNGELLNSKESNAEDKIYYNIFKAINAVLLTEKNPQFENNVNDYLDCNFPDMLRKIKIVLGFELPEFPISSSTSGHIYSVSGDSIEKYYAKNVGLTLSASSHNQETYDYQQGLRKMYDEIYEKALGNDFILVGTSATHPIIREELKGVSQKTEIVDGQTFDFYENPGTGRTDYNI